MHVGNTACLDFQILDTKVLIYGRIISYLGSPGVRFFMHHGLEFMVSSEIIRKTETIRPTTFELPNKGVSE